MTLSIKHDREENFTNGKQNNEVKS